MDSDVFYNSQSDHENSHSKHVDGNNNYEQISKVKEMSSETGIYDDISDFEEIVQCPIHIGIMDNPWKLSCHHAFCYDCIKKWFEDSNSNTCPICRSHERNNDLENPPIALVENELINTIMKRRLRSEESLSTDRKIELDNYRNRINKEIFKRNFDYETILSVDVENIYQTLDENKIKNVQLDFFIFDINITDEPERDYQLVFVDKTSDRVINYSRSQQSAFLVYVQREVFKSQFLRIFHNTLLLSGYLQHENSTVSIFLQCNMKGEIIHQSKQYPTPNSPGIPMKLGFDIDQELNEYFLCNPMRNKIQRYRFSFEISINYKFTDIYPEYIAFSAHLNQLYISCPRNQKLLIMNRDSGIWRHFRTDQINGAFLKMIHVIDDEKLIFLDSLTNRIICFQILGDDIIFKEIRLDCCREFNVIGAIQVKKGYLLALFRESGVVLLRRSN